MKNILIAVLIVIVIILSYLQLRPNKVNDIPHSPQETKQVSTTTDLIRKLPGQGDLIGWKATQRQDNQVFYNEQWKVMPQESGYTFELASGNVINWGLNGQLCDPNTQFTYGSSSVACVNGWHAYMGLKNTRDTLTKQDLNDFGDFVLKNQ